MVGLLAGWLNRMSTYYADTLFVADDFSEMNYGSLEDSFDLCEAEAVDYLVDHVRTVRILQSRRE